jgi:hypothetical protein
MSDSEMMNDSMIHSLQRQVACLEHKLLEANHCIAMLASNLADKADEVAEKYMEGAE